MRYYLRRYTLAALTLALSMSGERIAAQSIGAEDGGTVGFNQYGSSGLFMNPTSSILRSGHIGVGAFYTGGIRDGQTMKGFPLSFGFGVAKRTEAFLSFVSLSAATEEEQRSTFGIKASLLHRTTTADALLSADLRVHRIERSSEHDSPQDATGISTRLIVSAPIWGQVRSALHLGYWQIEAKLPGVKSRIVGGGGITVPLGNHALIGAEVQMGEQLDDAYGISGNLGMKWFLLQHMQLAMGVQARNRRGHVPNELNGMFVGISFSSGALGGDTGVGPPGALPQPPPLEEVQPSDSTSSNRSWLDGQSLMMGRGLKPNALGSLSERVPSHDRVLVPAFILTQSGDNQEKAKRERTMDQ